MTFTQFDIDYLSKCDKEVRYRVLLEMAVVRHMLTALIDQGFAITVDDGGDDPAIHNSTNVDDTMSEVLAVDTCVVLPYRNGKRQGRIELVLGNDGYDVINDHSVSLEAALESTNRLAEALESIYEGGTA